MSKKVSQDIDSHYNCLASVALSLGFSTAVPRERVLAQVATSLLVRHFTDRAFTKEEALSIIRSHGSLPELRDDVASSAFSFIEINKVVIASRNTAGLIEYHISPEFIADCESSSSRIEKTIQKVVMDLFPDFGVNPGRLETVSDDLINAISVVMERHGRQYAYQVSGKQGADSLVSRSDLIAICNEIPRRSGVDAEDLADAITSVFTSSEEHFSVFAFSVSEHYFYLRLLGVDSDFRLLSANRFEGSQFWLDTNILLSCLLESHRHHRSLLEVIEAAAELKASLFVTEETLDELSRVIEHNRIELSKTFDEVPDDLIGEVKNDLLLAYRQMKQKDAKFSISDFFQSFEHARSTLRDNWGICVEDENVEAGVEKKEIEAVKRQLTRSSKIIRGRHKSPKAQIHDAHVYYLVKDERSKYGSKAAYCITLDTSLPHAARELQGAEEVPYCITLDGFLHLLSPYLRSDHRKPFAQMFAALIGQNLLHADRTLQLDDFRMFTDQELSIRALPGDDVRRIIRRVKSVLGYEDWREKGFKSVAYEVQKALSDPYLKYNTALEKTRSDMEIKLKALEQKLEEERKLGQTAEEEYRMEIDAEKGRRQETEQKYRERIERYENEQKQLEAESGKASERYNKQLEGIKGELQAFKGRVLQAILSIGIIVIATLPWLLPKSIYHCSDTPIILKAVISTVIGALLPFIWIGPKARKNYGIAVGILAGIATIIKLVVVLAGNAHTS